MAVRVTLSDGAIKFVEQADFALDDPLANTLTFYDKNNHEIEVLQLSDVADWHEGVSQKQSPVASFDGPIIGKDIPWESIRNNPAHYKSHLFLGKFVDGRLVDFSKSAPYAFIATKTKEFRDGAVIPVAQRIDFRNLWKLNEKGYLNQDKYSMLISFRKYGGILSVLGGMMPHLEYTIFDSDNEIILMVYDQDWNTDPNNF